MMVMMSASRAMMTMLRNQPGRPMLSAPSMCHISTGHTAMSTVIQVSSRRQCGSARTAGTTNQREYCGLHTLLKRRKNPTMSTTSSAMRGVCGAFSPSTSTARQPSRKSTKVTALRMTGAPSPESKPSQPVMREITA